MMSHSRITALPKLPCGSFSDRVESNLLFSDDRNDNVASHATFNDASLNLLNNNNNNRFIDDEEDDDYAEEVKKYINFFFVAEGRTN